jgi:hypothetical protein
VKDSKTGGYSPLQDRPLTNLKVRADCGCGPQSHTWGPGVVPLCVLLTWAFCVDSCVASVWIAVWSLHVNHFGLPLSPEQAYVKTEPGWSCSLFESHTGRFCHSQLV